jgi:hypothetical protein
MKTIVQIFIVAAALTGSFARAEETPHWLVGFWTQVVDEDGRAGDETLLFRRDGSVAVYGSKCQEFPAGTFHLYKGNVYATFKAPKGLVSAIYVPSKNHDHLTFTSPRTGNNAVYAPATGCIPLAS